MKQAQFIQMQKLISTSMTFTPTNSPQWVSDTQINYMSQFDFVTYDLDQDRIQLIPRPFHHQIVAVHYLPLIGHRNVRIIYLYQQKQENYEKTTKVLTNDETNTMKVLSTESKFGFVILPSFNFSQDVDIRKVEFPNVKVLSIRTFTYFPQGHFVIFVALFETGEVRIVYLSLTATFYFSFNCQQLQRIQQSQIIEMSKQTDFSKRRQELARCNIYPTKETNEFIFVRQYKLYLFKIVGRQFMLLYQTNFSDLPYQDNFGLQNMSISLSLGKSYFIYILCNQLLLFLLDDTNFVLVDRYETIQDGLINPITCIAGTSNNRILLTVKDTTKLYEYNISSFDKIKFVNSIDLELQNRGHIPKIIISETGRNSALFCINSDSSLKKKHDILTFTIFKIQLYSQLGVPQSSLYIKEFKFTNRNKRVNRLCIPKIYEKLYALTGSEVHTLQSHRMSGILSFDIHPYGFYMVVAYSFNIKIYSIEHSSMTLLYSTSLQQLKKILYSPDGSNLLIFSSRKLKILDAFSFEVKYELNQKNSSIIDICFGSTKNILLILYDNGVLVEKSFYELDKSKIFRVYSHAQRKMQSLRLDEKNENAFIIFDDGTMLIKNISTLSCTELSVFYEDGEKISELFVDSRNKLIFIGTKTGNIRTHSINKGKFSIKTYNSMKIVDSDITALACSFLENNIYVGSLSGDISLVKYSLILGPELASSSSGMNMTTKVAPYYNLEFELVSSAKLQGNSEKNALEDKLQNLIQKIQTHTANFRQSIIKKYKQKETQLSLIEGQNPKNSCKQIQTKVKKLKIDLLFNKEKYLKQKKEYIEQYEQQLKILYLEQDSLNQKKQQIEQFAFKKRQEQKQMMDKQLSSLFDHSQSSLSHFQNLYEKEKFLSSLGLIDDEQYRISDMDVLISIRDNLNSELQESKLKSMQLKKSNSYLETARINIFSRKIQQETLQLRINHELQFLREITERQKNKKFLMVKELKSSQDLIHQIQNKVKNTPNNVISSDKADSDLCSYKIWMKNKVGEEVEQLEQYWKNLNQNFEKKSQQIVELSKEIRRKDANTHKLVQKEQMLKRRLKELVDRRVILQNGMINLQKRCSSSGMQQLRIKQEKKVNYDAEKIKRITSVEKLKEKVLYFENKNLKIHKRKINKFNSNNAQLLHEYQKLKYENKFYLDKQMQLQQIIVQMKQDELNNKSSFKSSLSDRIESIQQGTPFLLYLKHKAKHTRMNTNLLLKTATSTPRMDRTARTTVNNYFH